MVFISISCKENIAPSPKGNINNLDGSWVSLDSIIVNKSGKNYYVRDTLTFSKDITINHETFPFYMKRTCEFSLAPSSYYSVDYFMKDSLSLKYLGPVKIGLLINNFRHEVLFNNDMDTMSLIDFRNTYPSSPFIKFYKIE